MSPAIRAATPADLVAVTAIYDHAVRHGTASFELAPPDASEMARRRQALVDAGYPYLVAEIDGVIAGYAYAGPYRARPAYRWSVEDSIYVAPRMHRRGVGAALLGRLIADAEQSGFRQMIAVIGDSSQAPSIALHRAAGFRTIGTIENVGFKFGRWLDSVLMQRALGPGATKPPEGGEYRMANNE
ncbi:MAG TPA: GNAT family N-acetyltransferase [Xanthobacteraceae bacterium]|nr:GNAT family N-acetyltransferase [Xanthobacteraceae bacterium]